MLRGLQTLALHDHVGIDSKPSKQRTNYYSCFDKEEDARQISSNVQVCVCVHGQERNQRAAGAGYAGSVRKQTVLLFGHSIFLGPIAWG
jgi:hypothetical protein